MTWYAIFVAATGALVNITTNPTTQAGQNAVQVDGPLTPNEQWSPAARAIQVVPGWYAIVASDTGSLISVESPSAPKMLDSVLAAHNMTRVPIAAPFASNETWDPVGRQKQVVGGVAVNVVVVTSKQVNGVWSPETSAFVIGQPIQISATMNVPGSGDVYTGPGSTGVYTVPLVRGKGPAGSVVPTDEVVAIINLSFTNGVAAPVTLTINDSMWICAVPGVSSNWLAAPVIRAVLAA